MSPAKKPSRAKKTSGAAAARRKSAAKKTGTRTSATRKTAATARKTPSGRATPKKSVKRGAKKPSAKKTSGRTAATRASATKAERTRAANRRPRAKAPTRKTSTARAPGGKTTTSKLDRKALAGVRKRLEKERSELQRQLADIDTESFQGTQSDLTGEVGLDEDFADAGTATFDRERALSFQNNIRDLIAQIDRAIARIDEGRYGICERCGRLIDAARLKALPHAALCMDCKRLEERAR